MTDTQSGGVQPLEGQKEALQGSGMAQTTSTASGLAASEPREKVNLAEKNDDGPEDTILKPAAPEGAQLQGAIFVTNGSLPHLQVASNTGLVPAATVTNDPDQQEGIAKLQQARAHAGLRPLRRFTDAEVGGMKNAELRAYALDRGYDIGEGGTRVLRRKFLDAQSKDVADEEGTSLQKEQDALLKSVASAPASINAGVATAPLATDQTQTDRSGYLMSSGDKPSDTGTASTAGPTIKA